MDLPAAPGVDSPMPWVSRDSVRNRSTRPVPRPARASRNSSPPASHGVVHEAWLEWAKVLVVPISLAMITASVAIWQSFEASERAQSQQTVERQQAEARIAADYVTIAVSLVQRPPPAEDAPEEEKDADEALREWAVALLVETSPVELSKALQAKLEQGDAQFPFDLSVFYETDPETGEILRDESGNPVPRSLVSTPSSVRFITLPNGIRVPVAIPTPSAEADSE